MIVQDVRSMNTEPSPAIGVLTGADRDTWTKVNIMQLFESGLCMHNTDDSLQAREHLITLAPLNRANLNAIEDSLFVVALDDWTRVHPSPHSSSIASEILPFGGEPSSTELDPSLDLDSHIINSCAGRNGHNRWFDKSICVSVESNSRASVVGEHSPCDALIPGIIADYMLAEGMGKPKGPPKDPAQARQSAGNTKPSDEALTLADLEIRRLSWTTDARVLSDIDIAESTVEQLVEDSNGLMLWYDEYGADWIKRQGEMYTIRISALHHIFILMLFEDCRQAFAGCLHPDGHAACL